MAGPKWCGLTQTLNFCGPAHIVEEICHLMWNLSRNSRFPFIRLTNHLHCFALICYFNKKLRSLPEHIRSDMKRTKYSQTIPNFSTYEECKLTCWDVRLIIAIAIATSKIAIAISTSPYEECKLTCWDVRLIIATHQFHFHQDIEPERQWGQKVTFSISDYPNQIHSRTQCMR